MNHQDVLRGIFSFDNVNVRLLMKTIALNPSISVSHLIQGMMNVTRERFSPKEAMELITHRLDCGITTFDTAQIYGLGDNEKLIGEALNLNPSLKQSTQWMTKTGINYPKHSTDIWHYDTRYQSIIHACEASLQHLGLKSIDIYLIHREDPLIDHEACAKALDECVNKGYIRSYGVSNFDPIKFEALQSHTQHPLVTNQIEYHLDCFEHIDNGNFDLFQKHRIHPLIWSPLAQGRLMQSQDLEYQKLRQTVLDLADKYHTSPEGIALAFVMHHPSQPVPIIGTTQASRCEHLIESTNIILDHQDWYKLYTAHPQRRLR